MLTAGEDRFTAGKVAADPVRRRDRRRPGPGPRDRAARVRQLHLRPGLGRFGADRAPGHRRPGRRGHGLADYGQRWPHRPAASPGPARPDPDGEPVPPAGIPSGSTLRWHDGSLSALEWAHAVELAVDQITSGPHDLGNPDPGALRKVVLARDVFAAATEPIDPRVVLRRLAAGTPDCYTFAVADLVGATPELLIRRQGREVSALILGGTLPREPAPRGPGAGRGPARLGQEHRGTRVCGRLDPGGARSLCTSLVIPSYPSLLKLANLHHLGTAVRGTLAADQSVLSLADAVHPQGRGVRDADRGRAGADPRAGAHGTGPVRGPGGLGRRSGQRRVRHRAAVRRAGRSPGPAIRRLRHRGRFDPVAEVAETEVKFLPMRQALEG